MTYHPCYPQPHRQNHNAPGHAHELTFSCYHGFKFLQKERTRAWLAESIEQARITQCFQLWAYVFMPEHVHLIVYPTEKEYNIAAIRAAIKRPVGEQAIRYLLAEAPDWIDRITRKRGKKTERLFWQSGGGFDRNIIRSETLMGMIDYIHRNPVRRGLVEKPEEWKWSSAAWYSAGGWDPATVGEPSRTRQTPGLNWPIVPDPIRFDRDGCCERG